MTLKAPRKSVFIEKHAPGKKLLDVGCSYGYLLNEAKVKGWDTLGIDYKDDAVKSAKEKFGIDVLKGSFEETKFDERSFDVVAMAEVVEHLINPIPFLKTIHKILKDDGILFITTPDIESPQARLHGAKWIMFYPGTHRYFYSLNSLERLLHLCGFKIKARRLYDRGPNPLRNLVKYYLSILGINTTSSLAVICNKEI